MRGPCRVSRRVAPVRALPGCSRVPSPVACCRHAPAARVILLPISPKFVKQLQMSAMTGEDGKLYIFRVRDMKTYLAKALAVHPVKVTKDFGQAFLGKSGIVSFDVVGWSDASGHLALWNGTEFRESVDDYRGLKDDPATPLIEPATQAMTLWEI